jgi:hypothetical protein
MDPYGTPCFRTILSEWTDPMETHYDLSVKYERIQDHSTCTLSINYAKIFIRVNLHLILLLLILFIKIEQELILHIFFGEGGGVLWNVLLIKLSQAVVWMNSCLEQLSYHKKNWHRKKCRHHHNENIYSYLKND